MNGQAKEKVTAMCAGELRYWAARGIFAWIRETGDGRDAPLGTELLFQAAQMGSARAKVLAAAFVIHGAFGITPDRRKGVALLCEAVADGCEEAELALARLVRDESLPDGAEAFRRAALALWREEGEPVAANRLMGRAARMSHVPAMKDYAEMLREGVGCGQDVRLAAEIEWQAEEIERGRGGEA